MDRNASDVRMSALGFPEIKHMNTEILARFTVPHPLNLSSSLSFLS